MRITSHKLVETNKMLFRFNKDGHNKFRKIYDDIKSNVNKKKGSIELGYDEKLKKKIQELLNEEKYFENVSSEIKLEKKDFKNSFELGEYLANKLNILDQSKIFYDNLLWDYLSLFYFNKVFDKRARGLSNYRYFLSDEWQTRYRHLIRTPWYMVKTYGKAAKLCLSIPVYTGGDWTEQFISHRINETFTKSCEIAYQLYYDEKNQMAKKGYSKKFLYKNGVKSVVPASLGRLIDKLNHFNEIYDIWSLSNNEIIDLLPKEFDELRGK